jgi:hypothetical protein
MHKHALPLATTLALFAVAACTDHTSTGPGADLAMPDLATPAMPDLASSPDLASPPDLAQLDCAQTVACTRMCPGGSGSGACVSACIARTSTAATPYFQPLEACAGPACSQTATDAGPPPCSDPSSSACYACVQSACPNELSACLAH